STIETSVKSVKSWLLHHDRKLSLPVKVPLTGAPSRLDSEELPTPAQLRGVLLGATSNERLCCAFMAFSGLRPQALGNYLGTDGLRIGDLLGAKVDGGKVEIPDPPLRVRVRAMNSKAGHAYYTFLGEEGVEYLRTVLDERARGGEVLEADSDVIHPYRASKRFVRALNIGDQVRLALRRGGITARPYVLRSYFASRLLEAQNAGKVSREISEYWMGHQGDITARHYTTGRARLPDSLIASMAEAYRRCEPYLSTAPTTARGAGNAEAFRVLLSAWYTDEEIGRIDLEDPAAVIEALRKGGAKGASGSPTQQVIAEEDLPRFL
ncbi:integrase/recombinase, partial [mine drainage metagenome]